MFFKNYNLLVKSNYIRILLAWQNKILWPGLIVFLVRISSKRKMNSHFLSSKLQKYKFKIKYYRIIPKYQFFFSECKLDHILSKAMEKTLGHRPFKKDFL